MELPYNRKTIPVIIIQAIKIKPQWQIWDTTSQVSFKCFHTDPPPKIWQTIIITLDYAPELDDKPFFAEDIIHLSSRKQRNQDVIDLEASSPVAIFYSDRKFYSCYQEIKERNQLVYTTVNPASYDNCWPDKTCLLVPQCHEFYDETNLISYACYCLLGPNPVVKEIIGPRGRA